MRHSTAKLQLRLLRSREGNIPWAGRGCFPSWKMDQFSSSDLMAAAQEHELKQFYPEFGPDPGDRVHCWRGRGKAIWDSVIVALGAICVDAMSVIHPSYPSPCLQHIWDLGFYFPMSEPLARAVWLEWHSQPAGAPGSQRSRQGAVPSGWAGLGGDGSWSTQPPSAGLSRSSVRAEPHSAPPP